MKRVKAFWNSIWKNDRRLVALCYAVFLAGSILASLYGFAEDAYQRARGNVAQTEISGAQEDIFALTDLEQEGDLYTSTSVDPRMELDLAAVSPTGVPAYVRRVTVRVTFLNMDPGELSVFYKPRAGWTSTHIKKHARPWSSWRAVWARVCIPTPKYCPSP